MNKLAIERKVQYGAEKMLDVSLHYPLWRTRNGGLTAALRSLSSGPAARRVRRKRGLLRSWRLRRTVFESSKPSLIG